MCIKYNPQQQLTEFVMTGHTQKMNGKKDITFLKDVNPRIARQIHANLVKRNARKEVYRWRYYPFDDDENLGRMTIEWQAPWLPIWCNDFHR